jgi:hypothetical protein
MFIEIHPPDDPHWQPGKSEKVPTRALAIPVYVEVTTEKEKQH